MLPGVREDMAYWKERALQLDAELAAVKMREAERARNRPFGARPGTPIELLSASEKLTLAPSLLLKH